MSYVGSFSYFYQARDAAGLQVYMTNERYLPVDYRYLERNNRALFEACRDGAEEICEVLINFGAVVNSVVVDQQTLLYIACRNAHPACVDLLLAHKANVNVGDLRNGRTPLMTTAMQQNSHYGLTLNQFIDNRCRCMGSLLAAGVAIDQTDRDGWTALLYATWNARLAEILVKFGANVNIFSNLSHLSALHIACRRNNADVLEVLLCSGAYVDAVNVDGWTPLYFTCWHLHPAVVYSLLFYNADIDVTDNNGRTAFYNAMFHPGADTSPNRVTMLQLMATCAQTRLEASLADWIRLARNERH